LEQGEISVDSVKFGAFSSAESIATSVACEMVPFSPSRVMNGWGDKEPRSMIIAFHMMSDRNSQNNEYNSVVKLYLVF